MFPHCFFFASQFFLRLVWLLWLVWLARLVRIEISAEDLAQDSGESGLGEVQGGRANHCTSRNIFILHCNFSALQLFLRLVWLVWLVWMVWLAWLVWFEFSAEALA